MNKDQQLTWELLIMLMVVLVLISPIGDWLAGIVYEMSVHHDVTLNFNPFSGGKTSVTNAATGGSGGSGGTTNTSGTSLFNVPIQNASGEPGTIQVVAHDVASAVGNATQGGNVAIGPAVRA